MYLVYAIVDKDNGEAYVGHTDNIDVRMKTHKSKLNCSSKDIILRNNYDVIDLELNIPTKRLAKWRERYYINTYPNCINTMKRPIISDEERKEAIKENSKKTYANNRDYYMKQKSAYRKCHKETLKRKRSKLCMCECGDVLSHGRMKSHLNTPTHSRRLKDKHISILRNAFRKWCNN